MAQTRLIILTGAPGSGKTTLAARINVALPMSYLILEDAVRKSFSEYREHRDDSLRNTRALVVHMTDHLLTAGTSVIIDMFAATRTELNEMARRHATSGVEVTELFLDTTLETTLARVASRGYDGGLLDEERVRKLWQWTHEGDPILESLHTISTDNLTPDEVFATASEILNIQTKN